MQKLTLLRGDWGLGDSGTVAAFTKRPGDFALFVLVLELPGRLVTSDSRRSSPESSKPWGLRVPLRPASTKPCFVFGIAGRVSVVVSLKFMSHATRAGLQDQNKNYMPQTHYCDYPKLIAMVTSARDLKRTIWLMVREKKARLCCLVLLSLWLLFQLRWCAEVPL